jgi:hypothetical protein
MTKQLIAAIAATLICTLPAFRLCVAADGADESDASTQKDEGYATLNIPASDFRLVGPLPGKFSDKPQILKSAEDLETFIKSGEVLALSDDADLEAINKQINFDERELLIFAWSGSGRDRLQTILTDGDNSVAEFWYRRGQTRDIRGHLHLIAVKKDVKWRVTARLLPSDRQEKSGTRRTR